MKTFLLAILCLVCCKISAQQWYLEKADATKLPISSASVDRVSNKVRFRILGANKDSKARFDDISSIYYNGRTFKVFKTDRKPVGFYVLT